MADGQAHVEVVREHLIETSESIGEIAKALPVMQKALGAVIKNQQNGHYKNNYADLSAVIDAVMPAMNDNGFSILQPPASDNANEVTIFTWLMHESGQWIRFGLTLKGGTPQQAGSAITYGRRYTLLGLAGVAPEDDDANGVNNGNASPPNRNQQPPKKPVTKAGPERKSKEDSRDDYTDLQTSLRATRTRDEQTDWWKANKVKITSMHKDFEDMLTIEMRERAEDYRTAA